MNLAAIGCCIIVHNAPSKLVLNVERGFIRRSFYSFCRHGSLPPLLFLLSFSPPQWISEAGLEVGQERRGLIIAQTVASASAAAAAVGGVNENNFAWTHSDTHTHTRAHSVRSPRAPNRLGSHERLEAAVPRTERQRQTQKTRQPSLRQATRKSKFATALVLFHPFLLKAWLSLSESQRKGFDEAS